MRAIGIDLGTTNSAAAIGYPEMKVLPTRAGEQLTPSVVSFVKRRQSPEGEIVVGRSALNNAAKDPVNTIFSIKRLMGRVYGEKQVDEVQRHATYALAPPPAAGIDDQGVRILLNGMPYSPTEVSAMILAQLKADAEQALGEAVTHAVITVPAYFEERQRKATAEAGERANLTVLNIIDEPTAAAIAFGVGKEAERHRVLVYDLGGGTFDISIIQMTGGHFSIMTIRGDNWLGGDDFDRVLVDRIAARVHEDYGFDPSTDPIFQVKAKVEAQKAKIALSSQQRAEIFAPLLLTSPEIGPIDVELEVTREEFESDIRPLVERTVRLLHEALVGQSLTPDDITEVLMVGGSTAVPAVQDAVAGVFGRAKVKRHVNPMECVALGAAILAASASTDLEAEGERAEAEGPRLDQVTAMDLGIAAVKGNNADVFVPIIPRGTPYPLTEPKRRIFYPTADDQKLIRVPVYEGLSSEASLNEQQGIVEFPLPQSLSSSTAVEVSFNYDRNRFLTVGVRVVGTDHFITETLRRDRPRMQPVAQSLKDDWREDLQPSVRAGRHFLETYGTFMTDEDRGELSEAIEQGQRALDQDERIPGEQAVLLLRNKIIGSGAASQLFLAERAMREAPPEMTKLLADAVAAVRTAYKTGDREDVDRLISQLRLTLAQFFAKRAAIEGVEDRQDLKDLLRVRE